jgi:ParE toxin of type II toxin-antitoxin system, parDE
VSLSLTLTGHVRADLSATRLWYDQQRIGHGDKFAAAFYDAVQRVLCAPTAHPRLSDRVRKCRLKGFPYSAYFHVTATELIIVALLHHRRSSEFVAEQLRRV